MDHRRESSVRTSFSAPKRRSNSVQAIHRNETEAHRRQPNSEMMASGRRRRNYANYGAKLYERGMRRMYEMEKFVKRAKSEQDLAELEAYSFKPQINNVSRMINRAGYSKAEDFLIQYGRAVKDKIDS